MHTNLQAVAIRITVPISITVCSIYLPDADWNLEDLQALIQQLPTPLLLVGDFNSHNELLGSDHSDQHGRIVEELLESPDLVLMNDGSPTYLNSRSKKFSYIDLSIICSRIATRFTWKALDDLHGSDHFPILIESDSVTHKPILPSKWQLKRADWLAFRTALDIPSFVNEADEDSIRFTQVIIKAAEKSIPVTKSKPYKYRVPWWNPVVRDAIKAKRAFNRFKRHPTDENLLTFKRARAIARNKVQQSKQESWNAYVSGISPDTTIQECWARTKRIIGKGYNLPLSQLRLDEKIIKNDPNLIADLFADEFELTSSTSNYDPDFARRKSERDVLLNFDTSDQLDYNTTFPLTN